ncbi:MAG: gliding motility protein GldL [Flavobacteriales bacterium]|nr:MAG: gliding motility protein GldL [Flavobacteriales bacterium]
MSNQVKAKGKLDPITFFYGFGASVVLVGAMFKFLGWNYANELFVVGLTIEALVFLVSAFERKVADKEYNWENVFPQLDNGSNSGGNPEQAQMLEGYAKAMGQFSQTLGELNDNLKDLSGTLSSVKGHLEASAKDSVEMKERISDFNNLMQSYNDNLKVINDKYNNILDSK